MKLCHDILTMTLLGHFLTTPPALCIVLILTVYNTILYKIHYLSLYNFIQNSLFIVIHCTILYKIHYLSLYKFIQNSLFIVIQFKDFVDTGLNELQHEIFINKASTHL